MRLLKEVELMNEYGERTDDTIKVMVAETPQDQQAIAIHLLYPDSNALNQAIENACHDNFQLIVIHNQTTWPTKGALK